MFPKSSPSVLSNRGNRVLTRKQHELLCFINERLNETGFSPSFEEMKEALDLKSKSGIHRLVSALEERGYLARRHHRARALDVLRVPENMAATRDLALSEPNGGFAPNVIQGDFTQRLSGARTAQ